jgi:hypothetical protein
LDSAQCSLPNSGYSPGLKYNQLLPTGTMYVEVASRIRVELKNMAPRLSGSLRMSASDCDCDCDCDDIGPFYNTRIYDSKSLVMVDTATEIVIAKYTENTSWVTRYYSSYKCTIYDKSASVSGTGNLPNVGRESHSYVHHIIHNYDSLAGVTVFVQGNPSDHIDTTKLVQLAEEARAHPSGLSQNAHRHRVGVNSAFAEFTATYHTRQIKPFTPPFKMGAWWEHTMKSPWPENPRWYMGACFAATKQAIRSVPLETWRHISDMLAYDVNPITTYFMERCWYILLDRT